MKKPYCLKKPTGRKYYYYKLPGMENYLSTKLKVKAKAENFVLSLLNGEIGENSNEILSFYTEDMFVVGKCQIIKRQEKKGKPVTKYMASMRKGHLNNHISPYFGTRLPQSIRAVEIDDWLIDLEIANQTKNHLLVTVNLVFDELVLRGIIKDNPAKNIRRFKNNHKKRDILTPEEIITLFPKNRIEATRIWGSKMWETMFYTMLFTGLRLGEIKALKWKDWNRKFNAFLINEAVKNDETIGDTKNGTEHPIFLIDDVVEKLAEWEKYTQWGEPEDLIFACTRGKPINRKSCSEHFKSGLRNAGIKVKEKNITIHSLRHCMNTFLRKNLDDETVRLFTGHLSPAMTDNYDHPTDDDKIEKILPFRADVQKAWDDTFKGIKQSI